MSAVNEWVLIGRKAEAGNRFNLSLYAWWSAQSIANNTSTVGFALVAERIGSSTFWNNYDTSWSVTGAFTANGTWRTGSQGWSSVTLWSGSGTFTHNAAGDLTLSLAGSTAAKSPAGAVSVPASSFALPRIPRASSINSVDPDPAMIGSVNIVKITAASSSFTHKVTWTLGTKSVTVTLAAGAILATTTIPTAWAAELPNATAGSGTITLITLSGGTQIGSASVTKTFQVPTSLVPSLTATLSRIDNDVPSSWGVAVQGHSKARVTFNTATGVQGSTIASWKIVGPDGTASGTKAPPSTVDSPDVFATSGTHTIKVTITDSRNRSTSVSLTITVQAWANPTLKPGSIYRTNSAGTAQFDGKYASLLVSSDSISSVSGKNSVVSRVIQYRLQTASAWTSGGNYQPGTRLVIGSNNLSVTGIYQVRATITDALGGTATYTWLLLSADVLIHKPAGGQHLGFLRAISDAEISANTGGAVAVGGNLIIDGTTSFGGNIVKMPPWDNTIPALTDVDSRFTVGTVGCSRRMGMCAIGIPLTPNVDIAPGNIANINLFTAPAGFRPVRFVVAAIPDIGALINIGADGIFSLNSLERTWPAGSVWSIRCHYFLT